MIINGQLFMDCILNKFRDIIYMVGYVVVTTLSSATFSSWLCLGALALAFVIALVRGAIRWVLRAAMDGGTRP